VGNATAQSTDLVTANMTNSSTFSGQTSYGGYTYQTNVQYVSGLLPNTSIGINHNITVGVNGTNAIDGLVAILGVKIIQQPSSSSSSATSTTSLPRSKRLFASFLLSSLLVALFAFL